MLFLAGNNSRIYVYYLPNTPTVHTLAVFYLNDIYKTIESLTAKGVKFEHYKEEPFKTNEKGVVEHGGKKGAWFKDPDGHILGLSQIK